MQRISAIAVTAILDFSAMKNQVLAVLPGWQDTAGEAYDLRQQELASARDLGLMAKAVFVVPCATAVLSVGYTAYKIAHQQPVQPVLAGSGLIGGLLALPATKASKFLQEKRTESLELAHKADRALYVLNLGRTSLDYVIGDDHFMSGGKAPRQYINRDEGKCNIFETNGKYATVCLSAEDVRMKNLFEKKSENANDMNEPAPSGVGRRQYVPGVVTGKIRTQHFHYLPQTLEWAQQMACGLQ